MAHCDPAKMCSRHVCFVLGDPWPCRDRLVAQILQQQRHEGRVNRSLCVSQSEMLRSLLPDDEVLVHYDSHYGPVNVRVHLLKLLRGHGTTGLVLLDDIPKITYETN